MGVPVNTLLTFLLYQILLYGPIDGLPFASISSLTTPGLTSIEELTPESSSSSYVSNLVNVENLISSPSGPGVSGNNLQLFVGLPIGDTNYFLSQTPCLTENVKNDIHMSPNISGIMFSPSSNFHSNNVLPNPGYEPLNLDSGRISDRNSYEATTLTSTDGMTTVPIVNIDLNTNNLKRDLRDTITVSQEPCLSISQQNLLASSPICTCNGPLQISPLFSKLNPTTPCANMEVNLPQCTQTQFVNLECTSAESDQSSNEAECNNLSINPCKPTLLTNISPRPVLQSNLICPQENSNMLLALNILNNKQSSDEVDCSESIEVSPFPEPSPCFNTDQFKGPLNTKTNLSPAQMIRLNNNLLNTQIPQNNKIPSLTLQNNNANCDNIINQNKDLMSEYENVLRIRNSVIPQMLSNNFLAKSQNALINNNDDNQGCPQLETISVQDSAPFIQCNNVFSSPTTCDSNNLVLMAKNKLNEEKPCGVNVQNNNNQGCPQLTSIPVYNKESLLNKIRQSNCNNDLPCQNDNVNLLPLQNNNINCNNQNILKINQNVQGCPELLSLAQNNLYAQQNVNNNEDFICANTLVENVNCNCIQAIPPNDNLAQALKLVNRAKTAQATINILPFGETLLDGRPINNNLVTLESVSCPGQLPTCTCSDLSNSNRFLTIQDVSSIPFPVTQANPCSCFSSLGNTGLIPTNFAVSPLFSPLNTVSPVVSNFSPCVCNLAPSVPTISTITNSEFPISNSPVIFSQDTCCNSNIQPMFTLLQTPNIMNPLVSTDFIPVQSLPQVSFGNNLPLSTVNYAPSLSYPNNYVSSMSNIPSSCTAVQPIISPSFPLVSTNLQQANSVSGASSLFPSLNNIVSSLTQNIISTLMSKSTQCSSQPLAKLPPVNPFSCRQTVTETSPVCLDISTPSNCIVSSPVTMSGLSVTNIPVACNEYLPPMYNSAIIPTCNSNLFCVESDTDDSCSPFALSNTDAYYPEVSYLLPAGASDPCLCPQFMPTSSLPQSSSVIKINNTGREAKCYEHLLKAIGL